MQSINITALSSGALIKNLLLLSSFLSLIIGTIVGLAQIKIKRLLAYSTISHVGFLLLALSINTEDSLESLLFYLIQYSFTNLNTFFILLSFGYIIKKSFWRLVSIYCLIFYTKLNLTITSCTYLTYLRGNLPQPFI